MEELDNYFATVPADAPGLIFNHPGIRIECPANTTFRQEIGVRQRLAASDMTCQDLSYTVLEGKAHGKTLDVIAYENKLTLGQIKAAIGADSGLRSWPIDPRTKEPLGFAAQGKLDFAVYCALLQEKIQPPEAQLSENDIRGILSTKGISRLGGIALGFSYEEISVCYQVSQSTVKGQARNLLKQMGAVSRAHAIGIAFGSGIFKPLPSSKPPAS